MYSEFAAVGEWFLLLVGFFNHFLFMETDEIDWQGLVQCLNNIRNSYIQSFHYTDLCILASCSIPTVP
jgi:hypothetical protein